MTTNNDQTPDEQAWKERFAGNKDLVKRNPKEAARLGIVVRHERAEFKTAFPEEIGTLPPSKEVADAVNKARNTVLARGKARRQPEADFQGIWIKLPYNGCEGWSVNHFKVGGNMGWKRSPEAKAVKMAIETMLGTALMETGWKPVAPLHVIISGTFRDRRHCVDLHNTCKVVCDCVRDATGVDDKAFMVTTMLPEFDKEAEPEIRIEVRQMQKASR